jgi:type I restriction enzyme, S subunit
MIADLKPYSEYRLAEGRWLGEIPSHWTVRRMKYVVRETDSRSASGKEQLLRISQYTGVTQRSRADGLEEPDTRADSLIGYKRVEPNDLVINIMLAWNGSMGVSKYSGIASPAYCVYRFGSDVHPWYFHNLLRSPAYKARIKASSTGVVESRLRLYSDDLGRIEAMLPPPAEQAAIVRFLDWANGRLERAIRAKRKVIVLLNEQKQAIIHRAVTRGLDPSVPLKPSGISWLGEIPQHWEVLRSKYIYREVDSRSTTGEETHLSMSQKFGLIPSSQIEEKRLVSESYVGAKLCEKGDLVLNRLKAHLGVFALAPERGLVSPDYTVLRPVRELEERYFEVVYRTPACRVELRQRAKGIVQGFWRLYTDDFYDIRLPVPPMNEQADIMTQLDIDLSGVNSAMSRLEREIELLREYRTRLVADVVTGKLDVREAAARLPEEEPPDTAQEDTDPNIDPEAVEEEAVV